MLWVASVWADSAEASQTFPADVQFGPFLHFPSETIGQVATILETYLHWDGNSFTMTEKGITNVKTRAANLLNTFYSSRVPPQTSAFGTVATEVISGMFLKATERAMASTSRVKVGVDTLGIQRK